MILPLLFAMLVCRTDASTRPNVDNCDWVGSGGPGPFLSRSVRPVYLRCSGGAVRWLYPSGALRVVLQGPQGPFAACVRRAPGSGGARLYVAGRRSLLPVFGADDPADRVRCVVSQGGEVALYAEAHPTADPLRKATTHFHYQLKPLDGQMEHVDECEPCTEKQLLRHYCSSDFVIQGSVSDLFHNSDLQQSELTVRVSKLHRNNSLNRFTESGFDSPSPKYVVLRRPLRCGTKSGSGEYLFLGKWELGNPSLNCAPRISEWKHVRRKALQMGTNECLLDM